MKTQLKRPADRPADRPANGPRILLLLVLGLFPIPSVSANDQDVAKLRYGGNVAGSITEYTSGVDKGRLIRVSPDLVIAVPEVEIRIVQDFDATISEYKQLLAVAPETADGQWKLSQWCNKNRMKEQNLRHLRRVIELDPNHGPARQLLGYEPMGNGWVVSKSLRRERGLLREGGKWRFAEEVIIAKSGKDQTLSRKEWKRKLPNLKKQAMLQNIRGQEAVIEIRNLNDPTADEAVIEEFMSGVDIQYFPRVGWLEIMERLQTPLTINAMVKSGLDDRSETIRDRCLEFVGQHAKYQAISYYVSLLKNSDNTVVRKAGRALTELNDPEIALDLVEALRTKHKRVISGGGNDTNIGMSRDGSGNGGMQFGGGKPVVLDELKSNPEVLDALQEIVPENVDFQYDQDRWRRYFASRLAPTPGDLRRDP